MKRYFPINRRQLQPNKRTGLFGIITLVAILSGLLLFFTNEKQNAEILSSYCGGFGLYGKSLVLMKDSTFRFSYYGCSQTNGYVSGQWNSNGQILTLIPAQIDDVLNLKYQKYKSKLIPLKDSSEAEFVLCKNYEHPTKKEY
ncbi:hypothetical protein [Marivirga arenosa]|uniref:Uncharacterized protein n=1 Tax=Marivirga arenosa TaxID=3059076 RepID=A0AA52EXK9_9BACT|nr:MULTISPECIES: hypothetical protein [unclassified Marivirga]WKK85740.1 hypothetical protein QYS48_01155 [Marivirga sp. ABR2-2]WNB17616.1 hypothetical protein QYS47_34485 [Marivirga sp. BKB1-2]